MRHILTIAMMTAALLSGGCAVTEEISTALFDTTKINLAENTYAATDILAQQTKAHMTPMTPMKLAVISNVAAPEEITPFGQQLANNMGSRFVQLGYNVQSMPQPPGIMALSSSAPTPLNPAANAPQPKQMGMKPSSDGDVLATGTYSRGGNEILVSLRVIQSPDQRIIAAYDYTLPLTHELRKMTMTAAERKKREDSPVGTFLGTTQ